MNEFNTKIVLDSSADLPSAKSVPMLSVPLKIITADKEFVDNEELNVDEMIDYLKTYTGKSKTSCPNPQEYLEAFGDAENVFCITITNSLSGSYNAACIAKAQYEEAHPERKVYVFDSLSAGPELAVAADFIDEAIAEGKSFGEICDMLDNFRDKTGLVFMLESLKNLANNGRVSPLVAKVTSVLGIRVVGKASDEGTLQPLEKCRGGKKAVAALAENMKKEGFKGGKVKIAHCRNEAAARSLCDLLQREFGSFEHEIYPCHGLCSFYAEEGGLLVGFEK